MDLNGYDLSRSWFDFSFENPDLVKPNHTAIYFFTIEHCNRLGWKKKFGLPTSMVMEAVSIKSYNTYIKCLTQICSWGFIKLIEKSKNQYSSNVVALSNNDKAHNKALDKALIKHSTKQSLKQDESTVQSIDSIIKQLTKNKEQLTIEQRTILYEFVQNFNSDIKPEKIKKFTAADFKKTFLDLGADEIHLDDWMEVRKKKKAVNSQTALKKIVEECNKHDYPISEAVKNCAENSWSGFKFEWIENSSSSSSTQKPVTINRQTEEVIKANMELVDVSFIDRVRNAQNKRS